MSRQKVRPGTLAIHLYLRDPVVTRWIESLPPRHRSKAVEMELRRALEREDEHRELARRVAEELGRWFEQRNLHGIGASSSGSAFHSAGTPRHAVPQNPVTAFLRTWGDEA